MTEKVEKQGRYPIKWTELHCPGCGRWVGDYRIIWGQSRFYCKPCKKTVTVGVMPEEDDQEDIEAIVESGATYSHVAVDKPDG